MFKNPQGCQTILFYMWHFILHRIKEANCMFIMKMNLISLLEYHCSFLFLRVVPHYFSQFTLGWFVSKPMVIQSILVDKMTAYEVLLLMVRCIFAYCLFETVQDHLSESCNFFTKFNQAFLEIKLEESSFCERI